MFAWINLGVLVSSTILTTLFYIASTRVTALVQKMGDRGYRAATAYRIVSSFFMTLAGANYILYLFFPLPLPPLNRFPWPYWVSAVIATVLALPSLYLWVRGMIDAGKGSIIVPKKFKPYGGIYKKIRHPQTIGELVLWWVMALFLNSPFLALYSLVWIPAFIWFSLAEERDLILRHGDYYRQLKKQTGFFLPKLTK
jgi:protein-S-isoprenylcysteine O-methyltransferase Ste14